MAWPWYQTAEDCTGLPCGHRLQTKVTFNNFLSLFKPSYSSTSVLFLLSIWDCFSYLDYIIYIIKCWVLTICCPCAIFRYRGFKWFSDQCLFNLDFMQNVGPTWHTIVLAAVVHIKSNKESHLENNHIWSKNHLFPP